MWRILFLKWSGMEENRAGMLIGSINHSIDAKGRYIVPAKFRADLGERFVVTEGVGGCLFVFTLDQWESVSRSLAELPANDEATLRLKRDFFSHAYDLEIDKQYRIVLPPLLRELANLDKDIVTVGMTTRLEIWGKEDWESYTGQAPITTEQKTSVLSGVVL